MDPDRRAALVSLFLSLFNTVELLAFIGQLDPSLLHLLPGSQSPLLPLIGETIGLLERHGHLRGPLFPALTTAFPLRHADIERVAASFADAPQAPRWSDPDDYSSPHSLFDGDDP